MREFVELYLKEKNLVEHQLNSYNDFIDSLPAMIKSVRVKGITPRPGVIKVDLPQSGDTLYFIIEEAWIDNPFNEKAPNIEIIDSKTTRSEYTRDEILRRRKLKYEEPCTGLSYLDDENSLEPSVMPIPWACRLREMTYESPIRIFVRIVRCPPDKTLDELLEELKKGEAKDAMIGLHRIRDPRVIIKYREGDREVQKEGYVFTIGHIPIMLKSKLCWLNKKNVLKFLKLNQSDLDVDIDGKELPDELYEKILAYYFGEDPLDPGGYFIINGTERAIVPTEELITNKIFVEREKRSGKEIEVAKMFSFRQGYKSLLVVERERDGILYVSIPQYRNTRIPIVVFLKALGMTDEEIMNYMIPEEYKESGEVMGEIPLMVRANIEYVEEKLKIMTQEEALRYLAEKYPGRQNIEAKIERVNNLLDNELLPHIGKVVDYMVMKSVKVTEEALKRIIRHEKAKVLARVGKAVLRFATGERDADDRDHYGNKRLKLAGDLLREIVRIALINLIRDFHYHISKKLQNVKSLDDLPPNFRISTLIRKDAFDKKIKNAMATGTWPGNRTGVCQPLERISYISVLALLRRIRSTLARDQPHFEARDLHPTHWGRLCPNETPEGQNCGLVKNLALGAEISRKVAEPKMLKLLMAFGVESVSVPSKFPTVYLNNIPVGVMAGDLERPKEAIYNAIDQILSKAILLDNLEDLITKKKDLSTMWRQVTTVVARAIERGLTKGIRERIVKATATELTQERVISFTRALQEILTNMLYELKPEDDKAISIVKDLLVYIAPMEDLREALKEVDETFSDIKKEYPRTYEAVKKFVNKDNLIVMRSVKDLFIKFLEEIRFALTGPGRVGYEELKYARLIARTIDDLQNGRIKEEEAIQRIREARGEVINEALEQLMKYVIEPEELISSKDNELSTFYRNSLRLHQYVKAGVFRRIVKEGIFKEVVKRLEKAMSSGESIRKVIAYLRGEAIRKYEEIIYEKREVLISEFMNSLKAMRRGILKEERGYPGKLRPEEIIQINIRYDENTNEIFLNSDAGRVRRPLISVRTLCRIKLTEELYKYVSKKVLKGPLDYPQMKKFFNQRIICPISEYLLLNDVIDESLKGERSWEVSWSVLSKKNPNKKERELIGKKKELLLEVYDSILEHIKGHVKKDNKDIVSSLQEIREQVIEAILDYFRETSPDYVEKAKKSLEEIRDNVREYPIKWKDLVNTGIIEYIDADEEENLYVALYPDDLTEEHTHLEIDPVLILGMSASLIPYPEHNSSPRNVYGANMMRQAIGLFQASYNLRADTRQHILHYPEVPIVQSVVMKHMGFPRRPAGQNFIVAILSYEGYNMQDAIIFNKGAIDRALARVTTLKLYETKEQSYPAQSVEDIITNPLKYREANVIVTSVSSKETYEKLDVDGIVVPGSRVYGDYVVVGKVSPPRFFGGQMIESKKKDTSLRIAYEDEGVIDKVFITIDPYEQSRNKIVKVKLRKLMIPQLGDKFASRHGQKGVIGMIVPEEDMPFTEDGIVPDIIFNPHSVPSRKTVGHILEMLAGKVGALQGRFVDGTPFSGEKEQDLRRMLKELGFSYRGVEVLYDGRTGRRFKAEIYVGIVYYQRLHHMVTEKLHARSRGPVQILTKQPTEGRAREGGLRFGEMEKDCLIGHGAAMALKDRLLDQSDRTIIYVCGNCGHVTFENQRGEVRCHVCGETERIYPVEVSYAFKLLLDELKSMLIFPRLDVGDVL